MIGPIEGLVLLIFVVVGIAVLAVIIWGLIDAAQRPTSAFEAAGQNKTLWIVLLAIGLIFTLVGLIAAIIYFTSIRPKVIAAGG